MNWVFLPNWQRWVNIDHIASVCVKPDKDGDRLLLDKNGETHETSEGDMKIIAERIAMMAMLFIPPK